MDHSQTPALPPDRTSIAALSNGAADSRSTVVLGLALIGVLGALGIALAYSSGAYLPRSWLPVLLATAGLALVLVIAGPPVRWTRWQMAFLAAFAAQAAWTAASLLWAGSPGNAWEEANRTFLYLLGFLLAAAGVCWAGRRGTQALVIACLAVVGAVAAGGLVRLATVPSLALYFADGRLHYPVTYWNGLAALYMLGFWLALGLASGRPASRTWAWTRPLLLGLAVVLGELALLPQSRGALFTFLLVAPFFVGLSPHRFRALVNLALVGVAAALAWSRLMAVYPAVRDGGGATEVRAALWAMLLTAGAAAVVCALTWLVELRAGPLGRRWIRRISLGIAACVVVAAVLGAVGLERRVGDLGAFAHRSWDQFTSDTGPAAESSSRFSDVGLNGRLQLWRASADAFALHPVLGVGAQNFEPFFYRHRTSTLSARQPHSQPVQLAGELGLPGLLLWLFRCGGRDGAGRRHCVSGAAETSVRLLLATMIVAFLSWFVHSSVDWLWQLVGVSWPALLLLGGLLASGSPAPRPAAHHRAWNRAGRWATGVLVSLILVSAALSYLATVYNDASQVNAGLSPAVALADARTAARFDPLSPLPTIRQAEAYTAAAKQPLPAPPQGAPGPPSTIWRSPARPGIRRYAGAGRLGLGLRGARGRARLPRCRPSRWGAVPRQQSARPGGGLFLAGPLGGPALLGRGGRPLGPRGPDRLARHR